MTVYTDSQSVAALLGRTLTSAQQQRADTAAEAASDFIEQALGRSWLEVGGLVENERHTIRGCRIWLDHPPVVNDETLEISVRMRYPNATSYALTYPYQFELIEPDVGHLYVSPTMDGQLASVSYTSTETIPALIVEFATQLAAGMLALSLGETGAASAALGVKSYTLWGGDLRVEYSNAATGADGSSPISSRLPSMWAQIEALYSRKLAVA